MNVTTQPFKPVINYRVSTQPVGGITSPPIVRGSANIATQPLIERLTSSFKSFVVGGNVQALKARRPYTHGTWR